MDLEMIGNKNYNNIDNFELLPRALMGAILWAIWSREDESSNSFFCCLFFRIELTAYKKNNYVIIRK